MDKYNISNDFLEIVAGTTNRISPVYKEAATYFVNACGSKITCNGFVFIPGATSIGNISFAGAGTGINGITVDGADNANAPVFNLAGQRVSKDAKGILIQNGKKFIK